MELYPIDIAIHVVNIIILYVILRALLWKPVKAFMADREARIKDQMDQAARLQQEAGQSKAEYDRRLSEAAQACEQLMAEGRKQAMASSQKFIDEAKEEARQIVAQARTEAEDEKQRALDGARSELSELAVDMAGRVLRIDENIHHNILTGAVEKKGVRKGILKTAKPCKADEVKTMTAQLENLLGCHLELETAVDPQLIGGFAAYVDGKVYDFSYAAQLSAIRQKLA